MRIPRTEIILRGIQIKSLQKAQMLAKALSVIEEECGVHNVRISVIEPFVCSWIDLGALSMTPMENLLAKVLKKAVNE
jgi:hypothetical protein